MTAGGLRGPSTTIEAVTSPLPIAFIGPLHWTEILIILASALMIFGGNLPEVALRLVAHFMRFRRAVAKMWRDTGLEDELRRVRREVENSIPREADFEVRPSKLNEARRAAERAKLAAARERESTGAGAPASETGASDGSSSTTPEVAPGASAAGAGGGRGPRDTGALDSSQDPDADRREAYSFEPGEGAIASGDDFGAGVPSSDMDSPGSGPSGAPGSHVEHSSPDPSKSTPEGDESK